MKIIDAIILFENKLTALNNAKQNAVNLGNITEVNSLDIEITETEESLILLRSL